MSTAGRPGLKSSGDRGKGADVRRTAGAAINGGQRATRSALNNRGLCEFYDIRETETDFYK